MNMSHKHNQTIDQRFPSLNVTACDFSNVFGGDLYNVATCVLPTSDRESMEEAILAIAADIVAYLKQNPVHGHSKDKIQIIISWLRSVRDDSRQIYKAGVNCETMEQESGKFILGWWGKDLEK